MKFVYVLEDDPKFQKEIVEAIAVLDPKIQVRLFPKLEIFAKWMQEMMTTGPAAIAKGGSVPTFATVEPLNESETHQLVAVISKIEFLGKEQLGLLRKTRDLFIQRKICTAEDPTAFVLTVFDDPLFKIRELEDRILNNVIFKPFDRLILIQHLTFAIDGRHPPSKYTIANQKTTSVVEMLKDIELEAITDIGMVTKSYREIPLGSVSKYYGRSFLSDRHRSLFAICQSCEKHPNHPDAFQAKFTYFACDQTQISNFRKKTRDKKAKIKEVNWQGSHSANQTNDVQIILLDQEENSPNGLLGTLQKSFTNITTLPLESLSALISDIDPNQAVAQKDSSVKALGGASAVTLQFDASGTTFISFESDKKETTNLFGVEVDELKKKDNWFSQALPASHKDKWRKWVSSGEVSFSEDNYLAINIKDNSFLVGVKSVSKAAGKFEVVLTEPSKDEQILWMKKDSRIQKPVHLIIASHQYFGEGSTERWNFIREAFKAKFQLEPKIIMTSKKDFSDAEERNFANYVFDIFFKPLDRVYLGQKLKLLFPMLVEKGEKIEVRGIHQDEIIKAVNPVTVKELSEAGFIMEYYRPIAVGSFREVILWQPYEIDSPEFLATCNYVEESQSQKGLFMCHFVYYGITDLLLKRIRIWIRDNYILSKEGQG